MTRHAGRALTIALVSFTLATLLFYRCLFIVDFCTRVLLFEVNGFRNRRRAQTDHQGCRRSRGGSSGSPRVVACVIGHREELEIFRACLSSYAHSRCDGALLVCIDGTTLEDMPMRDIYEEVFGKDTAGVIVVDKPLAELLESILSKADEAADNVDSWRHDVMIREACRSVKALLVQEGKFPEITSKQCKIALCFAQPHTNVRGIRFAAWILSLVIAEANDIHYIWSSDSDTALIGDVMSQAAMVLDGDPTMGGISTAISVRKEGRSISSLLAWTQHRCLIYLDAAFTASSGHSSCLTGPSTMYRAEALAQAIFPWYIGGETLKNDSPRMMANDDNQVTTCLGRLGWKRGYLTNCHVQTCAPGSLLDWIRQQCRWNRAYNHERFSHLWYSIDQGPLYLWWIVRDEVYDAMFLVNLLCLIWGITGYTTRRSEWVAYFVAQPIYNYFRSPERKRDWYDLFTVPLLVLFHHLNIQFVHIWSAMTPFEDVENTPAGERGVSKIPRRTMRDVAYFGWIILCGLLLTRWTLQTFSSY